MAIVEKMDGTRFNMTKYGFPILKIGPIDVVYDSENVKGRAGRNRTTRYHGIRKIQLKLHLQAKDEADTILLRDTLAEIFDDAEEFYIYEQVSRGNYKFEVPGQTSFKSFLDVIEWKPYTYRRWKVERINNDAIEWDELKGERVLEFETSDLPYAETYFTSVDYANSPKSWDVGMFAYGMGFTWDDDVPSYTHTQNNFTIFNFGTAVVNPRFMQLKITLRGHFANGVEIRNKTTGETIAYNKPLTPTDTLVIEGVRYTKNGAECVGDTNKQLLTIKSRQNEFEVIGGTVSHVEIEFPFYYL